MMDERWRLTHEDKKRLEEQLEDSRAESRLLRDVIEKMELAYNTLEERYDEIQELLERLPCDIEDLIG